MYLKNKLSLFSRSTFVFINPHTAMRMVFLQPLDIDVWYTLIICIVFINILLYITIVFEYNKYKQNLKKYNSDSNTYNDFCNDNTITFITVTIIGAFSQQGKWLYTINISPKFIGNSYVKFDQIFEKLDPKFMVYYDANWIFSCVRAKSNIFDFDRMLLYLNEFFI